jgi:hypothetical protein
MTEKNSNVERAIEGLDGSKRDTLRRLVTGTAFVAPVVASFAMDGLTISKAVAQSNVTGSGPTVAPSDLRLKTDVAPVGALPSGLGLYRFRYLGDTTYYVGVMAQEVLKSTPQAVVTRPDGFYAVDYDAVGTRMMTYAEWKAGQLN